MPDPHAVTPPAVDDHTLRDRLTAALMLAADARQAVAARDPQAAMDDLGILQLVIADLAETSRPRRSPTSVARVVLDLCARSPIVLEGECPSRHTPVPEGLLLTLLQLLVERLGTRTPGQQCTLLVREAPTHVSFVGQISARLAHTAQDRLIRGADGILARHGGRVVLVGLPTQDQMEVIVQVPAQASGS